MHPLVVVLLVACGSCMARYRGYESRNLIEREEPFSENNENEVECPVCDESGQWMPSYEECPILKGNKRYKRCELGTYVNKVCGGRRDCFRGPGEQCTIKRDVDIFGQKCAPGYYCNKPLGVCIGLGYVVDTKIQYFLKPTVSNRQKGSNPLSENTNVRSD